MARRKILNVAADIMAEILRGHPMSELVTDFPLDAEIIGCGWDETRHTVRLAVECPSFPEVEDGTFAPDMEVVVTKHLSELDAILRLVTPEGEERT